MKKSAISFEATHMYIKLYPTDVYDLRQELFLLMTLICVMKSFNFIIFPHACAKVYFDC